MRTDWPTLFNLRPPISGGFRCKLEPEPVIKTLSICAIAIGTFLVPGGKGQTAASTKAVPQSVSTLADSLRDAAAAKRELHIFYVHGIGAVGPDDSRALRASICNLLNCPSVAGQLQGTDFADQHSFALNAPPPNLTYLGEPIWKGGGSNGSSEEWNASAPYVNHWQIVSTSGQVVYLDEINWFPLVFALKCREIVAHDARLAGPSSTYIGLCSQSQAASVPGRFLFYPWISTDEAKRLKALPARGALANRAFKNNLFDWSFSDALLAVGNLQPFLLEGIRELVIKSVGSEQNQEFVFVTHSLGSYLIFSALDYKNAGASTPLEWQSKFEDVLKRTPLVYFLANQLRILEFATLDDAQKKMASHLKIWADDRRTAMGPASANGYNAKIVAWSDPGDVLTWLVPDLRSVTDNELLVENHTVKNAFRWFGLFEPPYSAHNNYASNRRVIRAMLTQSGNKVAP